MIFEFEDFELDSDQLELRRGGEPQKVEPQVFSLLELLVSHADRAVTKDEINLQVWGGRVVSEAALSSRIRSARQAVGDDGTAQRLIKTLRDRGFRFVGDVTRVGMRPSVGVASRPASPISDRAEAPERVSIAVLPMQMLGAEPRYEPLADAISHEVITALSRSRWLHVIARGSSFRFRGDGVDLREAGRILGARYLLSGSLSLFGSTSVVSVELAEPERGSVVWADSFEQPLPDLLQVWREITLRVASQIEGRIEAEEIRSARANASENLDASTAYFRGLWHMYRFNAHDNAIAGQLFGRALEADPRFARAHAALSFTHFQNAFVGYTPDLAEQRHLARVHADAANDRDPLDPSVVLASGRADILDGRWEESVAWFERATELNPNASWAYYHRSLTEAVVNAGRGGTSHADKAISLSPVDPLHYAMLTSRGLCHLGQGEAEQAADWAERGARSPGAHVLIWAIAAVTQSLAGREEPSRAWAERIRARTPAFAKEQFFRAFPLRDQATREEVSGVLRSLGF